MRLWNGNRGAISHKAILRCISKGAVLICKGPKERSRILYEYNIPSSRVVTIQEVRGQRLLGSTLPVVIDNLDHMMSYLIGVPETRIELVTWGDSEDPLD